MSPPATVTRGDLPSVELYAVASFQLAGSLVLLLFGLQLVLGQVSKEAAAVLPNATPLERAIYPLAIPCIAGAGSTLTVVLLTTIMCGRLANRR